MHMSHTLATILTSIHDHTISAFGQFLLLRDPSCRDEQLAHDRRICVRHFRDRRDVSAWDDENVHRSARVKIAEPDDAFAFMHDVGSDFTPGNAAEDAIGLAQPSSSVRDPDSYGNAPSWPRYCSTTIERRHPLNHELIEHASRVLERTTGRSLAADALYEKVSREAGLNVGMAYLLTCVRAAADRFIILPAAASLDDEAGWVADERALYATALAEAGMSSSPTIMLAERPVEDHLVEPRRPTAQRADWDGCATADCDHARLLSDLHGALSDLLRGAGEDPELQRMISSSLAGIEAYRQLGSGS
jgi:hypothetical protein